MIRVLWPSLDGVDWTGIGFAAASIVLAFVLTSLAQHYYESKVRVRK